MSTNSTVAVDIFAALTLKYANDGVEDFLRLAQFGFQPGHSYFNSGGAVVLLGYLALLVEVEEKPH